MLTFLQHSLSRYIAAMLEADSTAAVIHRAIRAINESKRLIADSNALHISTQFRVRGGSLRIKTVPNRYDVVGRSKQLEPLA